MLYEANKYHKLSNAEIEKDLIEKGFKPELIIEEPNDFLKSHSHPENHILVVTDGEMKIQLDDREIIMNPGDKITIGSNEKHAAYFGKNGCQYYWIEY